MKASIMSNYISEDNISYECGSKYKISRIQIDDDILNFSINGQMTRDIHLSVPYQEEYTSFCFILSGKVTSLNQDGSVYSVSSPGDAKLVFHRAFKGSTIFHKTDNLSVFSIIMPYDLIVRIFRHRLSKQVAQLLFCQEHEQFCQHDVLLTPQIKSILYQMQQTRLSEELKYFFVASKTYELISHCLGQFVREHSECLNLSENDISCLKKAEQILSENIVEPPSIIQLARMVGINDCKLKRGFKQLFNTTPFAYVQELRMMLAKQSLLNGAVSVTAVANQVGYTNVGHFAAAFRKYYGTTPGSFKKTPVQMLAQVSAMSS